MTTTEAQGTEPEDSLANGRYALVSKLGEGGMAAVYKGYDHNLRQWRAIKVLAPNLVKRERIRLRFEAEAHAMAMLEHNNIVRVYDVGVDEASGRPYIVMEMVTGGAIVDWQEANGPMPVDAAIEVVIQMCKALAASHAKGIVHRDVKPHNVLLTQDGVCKLTDFGIAQVDTRSSLTRTGTVMGTLGFMAPEQRADAKDVDGRADVYACAATLHNLITYRLTMDLFAADQDPEMMVGIPPALRPLIVKATRYTRDERYDGVKAFARELREIRKELGLGLVDLSDYALEPKPLPPAPEAPEHIAAAWSKSGDTLAGQKKSPAQPSSKPPKVADTFDSSTEDPVPDMPEIDEFAEEEDEPEDGGTPVNVFASGRNRSRIKAQNEGVSVSGSGLDTINRANNASAFVNVMDQAMGLASGPLFVIVPIAMVVLLGGLALSGMNMRAVQEASVVRDSAYTVAIEQTDSVEESIAKRLMDVGANKPVLQQHRDEYHNAKTPEEKAEAAKALFILYEKQLKIVKMKRNPAALQIQTGVRNDLEDLAKAWKQYDEAYGEWAKKAGVDPDGG